MHQYSSPLLASAAFCAEAACWFDEVYLFESIKEVITKKETLATTQGCYTASLFCPRHRVFIVDLDVGLAVDLIRNIF